jgi:hypothetical protein
MTINNASAPIATARSKTKDDSSETWFANASSATAPKKRIEPEIIRIADPPTSLASFGDSVCKEMTCSSGRTCCSIDAYERLSHLIKKKAVTPRWVTALAQATSAGAQPMNS